VASGLTRNVDTFNPSRIATHEYLDMSGDVSHSTDWTERVACVARRPGWAKVGQIAPELSVEPANAQRLPSPTPLSVIACLPSTGQLGVATDTAAVAVARPCQRATV